jgi:hypothetical protein
MHRDPTKFILYFLIPIQVSMDFRVLDLYLDLKGVRNGNKNI